ncbi:MalY/PatB family protein [Enterococcus casseliflavus]|uniref:MalY/PatB family protein n=1 Tax=Enterococcus casseliflavus TaxID=37734 RepID=UPI0003533D94|nr:MalY/PatB family protein [Enterococcus casseliflavus]EPH64563.1 putative maltose regulon modulator MalY [Enterococcus casseliflavus 14-MB-W-14]MDB1696973.1 pyridoxal phosphate-dependent aminotransferase [Enterococcus casseliflavus]MDB1700397.1 pyridoxal phosphate-dependent aminotransferase [Enterococcus casseliflavus]MDB1703674.1 pyridoxal phosphate-dependent aminotransferase [Enterococcus casseliflavus]MDB1707260.1 pyridoxal phosphate-dependent aminotransferase [Enterococcus casseliflavus]
MFFDEPINRKGTQCTQWDYVEDRFGEKNLLPFTISDTDFKVPAAVEAALIKRMQHPVFGYTRWNHNEFKQAVCKWYSERFNSMIKSDWLVYSPSVMYSVKQLVTLLSEPGDGIIVQTPAYDAFYKMIKENKRKIVPNALIYDAKSYRIDFEELTRLMAQPENKVLLLCSPHNPTGRVWQKDELQRIIELAKTHDVFIISDEIHMDIVRKGQRHQPIIDLLQENVALVTSGSKTFNFPGLIYSYGIIPDPKMRERFLTQLKEADGLSSTSIFGMTATIAAYDNESKWVDQLNDYLDGNIAYVIAYLQEHHPELVVTKSEATYLMWIDCTALGLTMAELQQRMIRKGKVAIMSGEIYGKEGRNFLRLNIGCSREKLIDGLKRFTLSLT